MTHEEEGSNEFEVDWSKKEDLAVDPGSDAGALIIDQSMLLRRVLWDTVPCDDAQATAEYLQLPPSSPDVEQMEHDQSHDRLKEIEILLPMIYAVSDSAAKTITAAMAVVEEGEVQPLGGKEFNEHYETLQPLAFSVARAVVMELVSFGVVHLPHMVMLPMDEDGS